MAGNCLVLDQRKEIERLYAADIKPSEITAAVGVTTATIYRELKRGETGELDKHFRPAYSAETAEREVRRRLAILPRSISLYGSRGTRIHFDRGNGLFLHKPIQ